MAEPEDNPEEIDQKLAHAILGKFLSQKEDEIQPMLDEIGDPVVAAAVAIRVCLEMDPTQIAAFLAILEDESEDDEEGPDYEKPESEQE